MPLLKAAWTALLLFGLGLLLSACSLLEKTTPEEVKQNLEAELTDDSCTEEIEEVLTRNGIGHSFDPFSRFGTWQRYQGIIRDVSPFLDHAIVVYVYVDEDKCYEKVETSNSFTFF